MIFPPLPWAIKCFAAAWDIKNTLLMLRFITSSQSFFAERQRVLAANQAGIVDQNINMAELRHRPLQKLRNTVDLAQVGGQAEKTASQRGYPLDSLHRFDDIDTDNIAARFRQPRAIP
ncbi:Uncharacterised protein [Klebsiella pneumoniae]|uniref:Uncharacterized protein n=1 Tax=Klebsiella pneumoniae TaxID=573 RepID=A0A377V7K1_KLEPN|nr:Uncharacterised protein [Klebsiella pneumoniae]